MKGYYKLIIDMNKKENMPKRSFIPQTVGYSVKKLNRGLVNKFGKIEFIIHSKWLEITGEYFAKYSQPEDIKRIPYFENEIEEPVYKNYLNVSVSPAAALEFQHLKDKVIDKINSYFGYKAIADIKIQQNRTLNNIYDENSYSNKRKLNNSEKKNIYNNVNKMKNNDLKSSLTNLGLSITKEEKR